MDNILASSVKDKDHLAAFDQMTGERFYDIDLSSLIPNLFDVVPADALPYLALQYNLLGYNGWRFADTEQKQRDLLKTCIAIKKHKGTEYAIKEALKLIGMAPVTIRKGQYQLYCNGEQFANGSFACGALNPFTIQIEVNQADFPTITPQQATDMLALVNEYKALRDLLTSVNYNTNTVSDTFNIGDSLSVEVRDSGGTTDYVL